MVIAIIFLAHIIFIALIFYKKYKLNGVGSAIIDVVLIIILFSVGWSISTMVSKLFWDPIGFGKYFNRDAISLSLLTIAEYFFYKIYFKDLFATEVGKEK